MASVQPTARHTDPAGPQNDKPKPDDKPKLLTGWRDEISPLCALISLRLLKRERTPEIDVYDRTHAEALLRELPPTQRLFMGHWPPCRSRIGLSQASNVNGVPASGLFSAVQGMVVVDFPFRL